MFGGFGITELLVILAIVVMLFGTKKLRSMGSDLGTAIKGFRNAMSSDDEKKALENSSPPPVMQDLEGETVDTKTSDNK